MYYKRPYMRENLQAMQENIDEGKLRIRVSARNNGIPIQDARIMVAYTGGPQDILEEIRTDVSGNAQILTLRTPPVEYSMQPQDRHQMAATSGPS